ncbi:PucR family transcriptional regulator [Thermoactinomyces sp. CICC 10521]|uniref:PucR family transcriptional regulator n=1 Tax=Thermoactinomyces sp. CICC 10521 TaxID=2767426 RepID=UPI0018DC7C73|nr:PucR family transcriptional regulator [Thermoactinomyces sp. CICC 10521]MBH8608684.1 PucR family transcriptional regulator [Thermoactinomyces sp. CICC 10521]
MQLTVRDVMNIDVIKGAKVRTAENLLHMRPVVSVSVIEMPVEDFVQKNELVLTTAIGCGKDVNLFLKFVQDIIHSQAAALVIATGRHVTEIPEEILHLAETCKFPIIEIPWEIRFADITQAVLSVLHNWYRASLKRSEELQKKLLNFFLHGATLSDAAEAIHQELGSPVVIVDKKGTVKGKSSESEPLLNKWERCFPPSAPESEVGNLHAIEDSIMQLKIQTSNKLQGYLLFSLPSEIPADSFLAIEKDPLWKHSLTAVALWFQREDAIEETKMRLKDDFVWTLAQGDFDSWDKVLSRAKSLDYNVLLPYVCILGFPENMEAIFKEAKSDETSFEHWFFGMTRSMEELMIQAGEALQRKTMITHQRDRFILFLEVPPDQIQQTVEEFLDLVEKRLVKLLPGLVMSWGIGENHAGVRTFRESFNDARIALDIGRRQKGPGHRSTYANTGLFRALLTLASNPEMQEITLSTIGALIDYENQRGLDLMNTLTAYIRNQGNVSQTARALNLHRQSLLYRLRKIESLTGRSLVDPDDLFLLELSIKLWTTGVILNQK